MSEEEEQNQEQDDFVEEETIEYDEEGSTLKYEREEKEEDDQYEELEKDVDGIFISKRVLKILIAVVILVAMSFILISPPPDIDRTTVEYKVFDQINEHRTENINNNLKFNPKLREASRLHSKNMAEENFFKHQSPSGQTVGDRYEEVGYKCESKSGSGDTFEHIVRAKYNSEIQSPSGDIVVYNNEEDLIDAMARSVIQQDTENNLLDDEFKDASVGVHITGDNTVYLTFNLC